MYDITYRAPIANLYSYISTSGGPFKSVLHLSSCTYYYCFDNFLVRKKSCSIIHIMTNQEKGKINRNHKEKYAKCKVLKSIMLLRDTM